MNSNTSRPTGRLFYLQKPIVYTTGFRGTIPSVFAQLNRGIVSDVEGVTIDGKLYITPKQAAKQLSQKAERKISVRTVQHLCSKESPDLTCVKFGQVWLVSQESVDKFQPRKRGEHKE